MSASLPSSPMNSSRKGKAPRSDAVEERRLITPRSDLAVVRIGKAKAMRSLLAKDSARVMVEKITQATKRPGTSRKAIFASRQGRPVYLYSILPTDLTKIVREDAEGKKVVGRMINGRFRATASKGR